METKIIDARELRDILAVPESDTREQIVYIDVDDLEPDPRNFYELSDIDKLASNIALFGVQQPLRVRADPMDPDKYIIISGHRRREACKKLAAEGLERFRTPPCIIEAAAGSEALQELRLIFANSDTRKLTGPEISRQAERVEDLLYKLKEEGYAFPGRMRDHVAEACKVSKSKLARLKVIRDSLIPVLAEAWQRGQLTENRAYALSKLDREAQKYINDLAEYPIDQWYGWQIEEWARAIDKVRELKCPVTPGPCAFVYEHIDGCLSKDPKKTCARCCISCQHLTSCPDACHLSEFERKRQEEMQEEKEESRRAHQEAKETEARKRAFRWACVNSAVQASGMDEEAAAIALGLIDCKEDWAAEGDRLHALFNGFPPDLDDPDPILPYLLAGDELDQLCETADLLGCSIDYLLGRTDKREVNR